MAIAMQDMASEPLPGEAGAAIEEVVATDSIQEAQAPEDDGKPPEEAESPYSVLPEWQKKTLLLLAAFAAVISPFATSTYYPSVVAIAHDLHVSVSKINLTISTYQIFQGLAPTLIAALADTYGRRPAYLVCFTVYAGGNLGLALQDSYAALLVLRCIQSSGSSGTTALAQAVAADLAPRAERGKYLAYAVIAATVGPAMGPVAGGLLTQYLGWRSVFWFLLIFGCALGLVMIIIFPETARSIVGDASVPPQHWNRSVLQILSKKKPSHPVRLESLEPKPIRVNPLTSLSVLRDPVNFLLAMSGGFLYAGFTSVTSVFASQLQARFGYSEVTVGLCYLPVAFGSLTAGVTTGRLIDWNFRRYARKHGLSVEKNRQTDISELDTEKARLLFAIPLIMLASALVIGYGWEMQTRAPLAGILVTMFFLANALTGALVANTSLLVDINRSNAAALGAAMNLTRCLLSAGGVAAITPLIDAVGIGWASMCAAGVFVASGMVFCIIWAKGFRWRIEKQRKEKEQVQKRDDKIGTGHAVES